MLWEQKYEITRTLEGKLRTLSERKGSTIWNLASMNRALIRDNSFWEIREGDKVDFW